MGGHTKPLPVQANESHSISQGENASWSSSPLMSVVQIGEDTNHCPVPLIYKLADKSPPESGFLRSRENSQMWFAPNHLNVACRVVREQGCFSYSITHCTACIIDYPHEVERHHRRVVHLIRCVGHLMLRRVLVILLAYGRSYNAWDVVCLHHL